MAADKGNLIDITKRLKKKREASRKVEGAAKSTNASVTQLPSDVLDMTARRREMIQAERRNVRRTVISQLVGAFIAHPTQGLECISVHDVSESGLSFDLGIESGAYKVGDKLTLRIYMSHDLYFPFTVTVANVRKGDGANRHGVSFDTDQAASGILYHFVKFLEGLSTVARRDQGERIVGRVD